jgi:hypothetical protein
MSKIFGIAETETPAWVSLEEEDLKEEWLPAPKEDFCCLFLKLPEISTGASRSG